MRGKLLAALKNLERKTIPGGYCKNDVAADKKFMS